MQALCRRQIWQEPPEEREKGGKREERAWGGRAQWGRAQGDHAVFVSNKLPTSFPSKVFGLASYTLNPPLFSPCVCWRWAGGKCGGLWGPFPSPAVKWAQRWGCTCTTVSARLGRPHPVCTITEKRKKKERKKEKKKKNRKKVYFLFSVSLVPVRSCLSIKPAGLSPAYCHFLIQRGDP